MSVLSPLTGVQRTCTLRKNTIPVGPQYSSEFGKTSGSMNGLSVWPAPNAPSSPQAWRRRIVVWPASTPVPNMSNSNLVFSSPRSVGDDVLTPKRVWRTPAKVLLSLPNCSLDEGSLVTRIVSNQFGSICLKFWPISSIAKP